MEKLIEFTSKQWNDYCIILKYKKASFRVLVSSLNENQQKQLKSHHSDEYNITGSCFLKKANIMTDTIFFEFNQYGIPIQLIKHEIRPTTYVKYYYQTHSTGKRYIQVQSNGFLVYCAPTGQGKTWFALSNLEELSKQFDTILYINLELSIDDIKNRCIAMNINIPSNLYVAPLDNVEVIEAWAVSHGRCMFVIDNIDNLVGGGQDPFGEQLDFIKNLDRFLKDYNHHALVLTQLVKDNTMNLLAKDGEINDMITTNILSGVKQLSYLSRTVMMTAFSPELNGYVYKILKMGSAKV
jgi:hypothetical protein